MLKYFPKLTQENFCVIHLERKRVRCEVMGGGRGRGVWQAPLKMEKMYDGWMRMDDPYPPFYLILSSEKKIRGKITWFLNFILLG